MKIKRAVMLAVLAVAVAALAVPLVGLRARAAGPMKGSPAAKAATLTASSVGAAAAATSVGTQDGVQLANGQHSVMAGTPVDLGDLSPEVREAFVASHPEADQAFRPSVNQGKHMADIYQLARIRLAARGIHAVYGGGFCTVSDPRFYSYRRAARTGRFASLVWLAD